MLRISVRGAYPIFDSKLWFRRLFEDKCLFEGDYLGAIHKGRPADPGEGGLRNPDVPLLFECDSIVLSGRRRRGV